MERYSKKRQAILDCLRTAEDHPSAEWIYERLKPDYPSLSLATVYRNLSQFKRAGLIQSVGTTQGQERFDGNVQFHPHAVCTECGAIVDVPQISLPNEMLELIERSTGYQVSAHGLQFSGLCASCQQKHQSL